MKTIKIFCASLMLCAVTMANATMSYVDTAGNAVAGPATINGSYDAVYFSETMDGSGNGQYTVTNNTSGGYGLLAFGISNTDTTAWIGSIGNDFGCDFDSFSTWCYESMELDSTNWATEVIDFNNGTTGMDVFGDMSNVLDSGDNMLNFYRAVDGELFSGSSWDGFLYDADAPASQLFVVLSGPEETIYGSGGLPINAVPLPAAAWLFISGFLALGGMSYFKRKREPNSPTLSNTTASI